MKHLILFLGSLLLFSSCEKETLNDNIKHPYNLKWMVKIPSDSDYNYIHDPIIYNDWVIIPDERSGKLTCFDKFSGKEIWVWSEAIEEYGDKYDGFGSKSYVYQNILVTGRFSLTYGINLDNGQTIWHKKHEDHTSPPMYGLGTKFVIRHNTPNDEEISILLGNVLTGDTRVIYSFKKDDEFDIGSNLPLIFEHEGNEFVTFSKTKYRYGAGPNNSCYESYQWLHLYNLSSRNLEWVSDTIPTIYKNFAGTVRPVFHDGKILLMNRAVYSYDINDGNLAWVKYYDNTFNLPFQRSASKGKLFLSNNWNFLVKLDVHTGEEYFNIETNGSGSRVILSNDKAYSSAHNSIQIWDANSGELIKTIDQSDRGTSLTRYFDSALCVDHETGYIYTGDYSNILCIDPEL